MSEFGVDELDPPTQSPYLNPKEHFCNELEWKQQAISSPPTMSDLISDF